MTTIGEVIQAIEKKAPTALQESYDNAGLITGDTSTAVSGVLVCLDCTEAVVKEAISIKCNLIVSHHPLLFKPLKRITGDTYVGRTLLMAIRNNIALYAAHTNYDSVMTGVNGVIASRLGLKNHRILEPKSGNLLKLVTFCPSKQADDVRMALFHAGAGHIGNYDHCSFSTEGLGTFRGNESTSPFVGEKNKDHSEPETRIETVFYRFHQHQIIRALSAAHPYEEVAYDLYPLENTDYRHGLGMVGELENEMKAVEFFKKLKEVFGTGVIRHTEPVKPTVKRVAVCGGSGSFLLEKAIEEKADVFMTADITYHRFFDAEGKITLVDIGHYESEYFTSQDIADFLKEIFSTFATHFSKVNTNPIKYF